VSSLFYLAPAWFRVAALVMRIHRFQVHRLENLYVATGVSINDPASAASACGHASTAMGTGIKPPRSV